GVYLVTNAGVCTWHDLAAAAVELAGLDPAVVGTMTTAELGRPAPRPVNSVLSGAAWAAAGLPPLRPWPEALAEKMAEPIAGAARIICPSRSTALDVEEFYGVERDRIRVVPHGVDVAGLGAADLSIGAAGERWERRGIAEPYVLWVGTQEQRKNVVAVLDAFTHLAGRHPELSLVLHGPNGWLGDEVGEGLQHRGLHGRTIVSEGSLPRNELAALYTRASVFVYPSLFEGFGMPVLAAMACSTPVVTSNISALPETAGDAALLVDPLDDLALAEAMARILEDPDLAEDLSARGLKRAKALTWGGTARRTWA